MMIAVCVGVGMSEDDGAGVTVEPVIFTVYCFVAEAVPFSALTVNV